MKQRPRTVYTLQPSSSKNKGVLVRHLVNSMYSPSLNSTGKAGLRTPFLKGQTTAGTEGTDLELVRREGKVSVEKFAACLSLTVAGKLVAWRLGRELVVVGDFFAPVDVAQGEDDNALVALDADDA